ncbi:MAG: penicillin-binding protein activator [Pseudomonadota bacterium]
MVSFFKRFRNALKAVAVVGSLSAVAACDVPTTADIGGGGGGVSGGSVDVALLVPAGSGVGELDVIARSLENAARLAMADLNGVDVNLTVYNTARNTGTAVSAANQAIAAGADIILGPLDGEAAAAVGLATRASGRNVLSFSNNTAIAGGNVFILGQTFQDSANRLAGYARRQGLSRVAVVHAQNIAGEAGRAAVAQALASNGLALAGSTGYENSLPGVSNAVSQVRSTVNSSGADAIFLTSPSAGALPILAELLPEASLGPDRIQYLGLSRWDNDSRLFSLSGVQGGWFAMPDRARAAAFSNRYSASYGSAPHPLAFTAYDGMAVIGALVAQGGQNPLNGGAITRGRGFQGANGILRFRANGTNQRGLAVGSIQGGQVVTLQAAPQSFGGAGF